MFYWGYLVLRSDTVPSSGVTKRIIAATMKELMETRSFDKISVSDIVKACDLNRNSFYYHFKDKYDLVNWIFYTELLAEFGDIDILQVSPWQIISLMSEFFYKDKKFYRNALQITGQNSFQDYYTELMYNAIYAKHVDKFEDEEFHRFFSSFFSEMVVNAMVSWLKDGAKLSPDKFSEYIRRSLMSALDMLKEQE